MYATCYCLNVSIKTKENQLEKIDIDDIELSIDERADSFFNNVSIYTYKH